MDSLAEAEVSFRAVDAELAQRGSAAEAILREHPDWEHMVIARLAQIALKQHDLARAANARKRLAALQSFFGTREYEMALVAAVEGDREGTAALLESAVRKGWWRWPTIEPDFVPLRDYKPFRDIMLPSD